MGTVNPVSPVFGKSAEAFPAAGIKLKKNFQRSVAVPPETASS
jgi:hypothetical protein